MQIKLWTPNNFTKKTNSTKKPTGGTTVEGYLRNEDPFSMYAPRVRIDFSHMPNMSATTVPPYTYALIPNFGNRYYWITDWSHDEGIWEAQLQVDVLATYRDKIGDSNLYILRSSAESNGYIDDDKYPMTAEMSSAKQETTNIFCLNPGEEGQEHVYLTPMYNIPRTSGTYVIGVYGPNASGVSYYACDYIGFFNIAQTLYNFDPTSSGLWDFVNVTLPEGFTKALADPQQFIASVKWFPGVPFTISASDSVNLFLGYYSVGTISHMKPLGNTTVGRYWTDFRLEKHPQAARGKFLNVDPYSNYHITVPPFGDFDLDSSKLINCTHVRAEWHADYTSGMATLRLWGGHYPNIGDLFDFSKDVYLGSVESKFAVEVPLNQNTINLSETILKSSLIMGGVGALGAGAKAFTESIESLSGGGTSGGVINGTSSAASGDWARSSALGGGLAGGGSGGGGGSSWGDQPAPSPLDSVKKQLNSWGGAIQNKLATLNGDLKASLYKPLTILKDVASAAVGGFKRFNPGLQPKLTTVGGIGSFLTYTSGEGAMLTTTFYMVVDEDNADLGRPLCKIRKPKDLGGYLIAENPKIEIIGTRAETDQIKDYLTGGIFYE